MPATADSVRAYAKPGLRPRSNTLFLGTLYTEAAHETDEQSALQLLPTAAHSFEGFFLHLLWAPDADTLFPTACAQALLGPTEQREVFVASRQACWPF